MKVIFLVAFLIALISAQISSTGFTCNKPCYGSAVAACPAGYYCGRSISSTVKAGCDMICYKEGSAKDEMLIQADSCKVCLRSICSESEVCNYYNESKCSNCDCPRDATIQCDANLCENDCAKALGAKCVRDCGKCIARFFDIAGNEVCTTKPNDCTGCAITTCPTGQELQKFVNTTNGCESCKCVDVKTCPGLICPAVYCPYGYVLDANRCPTCECNRCPTDLVCPAVFCPYGYKSDSKGCPTCECQPATCPECEYSKLNCTNGFAIDPTTGCKLCKCAECPAHDCMKPILPCSGGYLNDKNGCPTCTCSNCTKYCPYGTKSDSCECNCPVLNCLIACPFGSRSDQYGCDTCDCLPNLTKCDPVECKMYCEYGYVVDPKTGCKLCQCNEKPRCPEVLCTLYCQYGYYNDTDTKCPTCRCLPCPAVKCSKLCVYGFQVDKSGCPTCICNEKPFCPATTDPIFTNTCNLKCENGFKTKEGCPICVCEEEKPCTCPMVKEAPTLCSDKITLTNVIGCKRDETTNNCTIVKRRCPVALAIETKDNTLLSDYDILRIKTQYNIPDVEVKIDVRKDTKTGKTTYILWINPDALPENFDFQDIADYQQNVNSNSVAYLMSSEQPGTSSQNNAFSIIAPLLAIVFVMFM